MKCLDLFSGIGGMCRLLPVDVITYVEKEAYPMQVLQQRMKCGSLNNVPIHDDVCTLDPPDHDIICAGFPCQDISVFGNKKGLKGEKSSLYHQILRIADIKQTKMLFLENVAHIRRMPEVWQVVLQTLHIRGYDATWGVLQANQTGAPHMRKRWFLIAKKIMKERQKEIQFESSMMLKFGTMRNGIIASSPDPKIPKYRLPIPIILRKLEGVTSKGNVVDHDVVRTLWATPRASICRAIRNLTKRGVSDLPNMHKFEIRTKLRTKYSNPKWVEWLMGLPAGWTDIEGDTTPHRGFEEEPCQRMIPAVCPNYTKRMRTLGNMCVSQCSRLAWDTLMPIINATGH